MAISEETGGPPDAEELHDHAVTAEEALEKLSTGLAQIGGDDQTVQALSKMAEITRKIASGLAKGMKEAPPEESHTMDSAMQDTMRERAAARQTAGA
jgi:hypothetical protein